MKKLKWTTVVEYVDAETGEVLSKKEVIKKYIITKKIRHVTINNSTDCGIIRWTYECEQGGKQKTLF